MDRMTEYEAIKVIESNWPDDRYETLIEALDMAINSLNDYANLERVIESLNFELDDLRYEYNQLEEEKLDLEETIDNLTDEIEELEFQLGE